MIKADNADNNVISSMSYKARGNYLLPHMHKTPEIGILKIMLRLQDSSRILTDLEERRNNKFSKDKQHVYYEGGPRFSDNPMDGIEYHSARLHRFTPLVKLLSFRGACNG